LTAPQPLDPCVVVRSDRAEAERRLESGRPELGDHTRPRGLHVRERVRDDRRGVARPFRVSRREMSLRLFGVRDRFLGLCDELVELGGDVVERGDGLPFFVVRNRTVRRERVVFKKSEPLAGPPKGRGEARR